MFNSPQLRAMFCLRHDTLAGGIMGRNAVYLFTEIAMES